MTTPREFVEQAYPDPSVRATVLLQLAESLNAADTISRGCWSVSFRQNQIRLNVGRLETLVLHENRLDVTVDRDATNESEWTHISENLGITFKWSGEPFRVLPSAYGLILPIDRIEELLPIVRPLHDALLRRAAGTVQSRTSYYHAHDPEVMAYVREEVAEDLPDPDYGVVPADEVKAGRRYWKISAGNGGDHWNEFIQNSWIAVDWSESPDLRTLDVGSPQALREYLNASSDEQSFSPHATTQLWTFLHKMTPGDRVCGYGSSQVLGWGEIIGEYHFAEDAHDFRHRREVTWESTEPIPTSSLALQLADKLKQNTTIIELTEDEFSQITGERGSGYWWVNQGATYKQEHAGEYLWAPKKGKGGRVNKHWTDMENLRAGDLVVHYANNAIRAVGRVRESAVDAPRPAELPTEAWNDLGYFARVEYFPLAMLIRRDEIPLDWRQPGPGPFTQDGSIKQGYLYPLAKDFAAKLFKRFADRLPPIVRETDGLQDLRSEQGEQPGPSTPPSLDELAALTHLDREDLEELEALLLDKGQLVLEGPPGSGKTYLAEHFARYFAGLPLNGEEDERVERVQFHQSYGYEEFVQGIRPITDEHGQLQYHVLPGIFMRMCDLAARNPDQHFVLIIDEINRGNLSRIFGELLLLLEYRDKRVRLPYGAIDGKDDQAYLSIPANLYLIGTMNSTDRSLALIDYALRRRFYFYRLLPVVDGRAPVLERWLGGTGSAVEDQKRVLRLFIALNREVERLLSSDFQIGHSYFMRDDIGTGVGVKRLWRRSIMPLLEEYLHGARDREMVLAELTPGKLLAVSGSEVEPITDTSNET